MTNSENTSPNDDPPPASEEPPESGDVAAVDVSVSGNQEGSEPNEDSPDRRGFLGYGTTIGMAGGLVLGYGKFAQLAGHYLYGTDSPPTLMFVSTVQEIEPGGAFPFETPDGVKIVITRKEDSPPNIVPPATDFLALSSTCPHLGCRVHWEAHNDRFFCPCHNGVFDPTGKPLEGPPKDADQHLDTYTLVVEGNLLFIELPSGGVRAAEAGSGQTAARSGRSKCSDSPDQSSTDQALLASNEKQDLDPNRTNTQT